MECTTAGCLENVLTDPNSVQLNGSDAGEHVLNGLAHTVNNAGGIEMIENNDPTIASTSTKTVPNYDDVFPALPGGPTIGDPMPISLHQSSMSSRPKIRSRTENSIYRVVPEELRSRNRRSEDPSKICALIMSKTGTKIQLTYPKDGSLTFLISGTAASISQAQRMLAKEFEAPISHSIPIPKEHHRLILGKAGKKLFDLENATQTKIQIPKQDEKSEMIRITGTREAIEKAVQEIQSISSDAYSRSIERISIPKIYHPFIVGPFGQVLDQIQKETGAKVNIPPPSVPKDEIIIKGDRKGCELAYERVKAIYEEKNRRCETITAKIKKSQHKFIFGPKGNTLNEIMQLTGVSVEIPASDSNIDQIVLRGEPDQLPKALSLLYEKTYSEREEEIEMPGWIHRHILGPKGVKFQELSLEFPKVNVSFEAEENRIKLSGPENDVQKATELIRQRGEEIAKQLSVEEIKVSNPNHIKYIVGRNGANLKHIHEDTKANIQVIGDDGVNDVKGGNPSGLSKSISATGGRFIRIEGSHESVAKAKKELVQLLEKLKNEVTLELLIERRFHGQIIGPKGEKIRDIRNKFNQVMIMFPELKDQSEKVVIRGAKQDAENCYEYLSKLNKELLVNNYRYEVPILKQFLQFQGKDILKKIREETGARLELGNNGESIIITGIQDKVEKAHERIQALQNNLSDMSQVDIMIPSRIHNYMLGTKGSNIRAVMQECGDVIITFPPEGSGSDRVGIRGTKDSVQKAKQLLLKMSNDFQTNNYSEEFKVNVEHHRYLIGKNGCNINKLRDQHNVRVQFSSDNKLNKEDDRVVITGKKEDVQTARTILEAKIKELENVTELQMRMDPKYHHLFVARRAALCKQIFEEYGGVNITFPSQSDKNNDKIILKGSKECLEAAKQRILEIVDDYESQVTIEVEIDAQYHRLILSSRSKNEVNALQQNFDVKIKFPQFTKPDLQSQESDKINDNRSNIVTISGRKENCEKAREGLLALVPVTIELSVPFEFHRFIIGQKGVEVRDLMEKYDVNIRFPPSANKSDIIVITGRQSNVEDAKNALEKKMI
ncbi:Vigilin-like protein [Sarcoptes scabiei]|uniref:Vigilin-like protein n=1 Tax=Sarcoptes scabiei TaxID=52283 RepID=A0A132A3V1_SARSC|nr:Vigilin-like protein [Sarcoptes scabiei]